MFAIALLNFSLLLPIILQTLQLQKLSLLPLCLIFVFVLNIVSWIPFLYSRYTVIALPIFAKAFEDWKQRTDTAMKQSKLKH